MSMVKKLQLLYVQMGEQLSRFLEPLALLSIRFMVAKVFLDSGLSKWDGFLQFNVDKYDLFKYEFFCPDPIRDGALLLCDPQTLDYVDGSLTVTIIELLAVVAGVVEVVLPILLIIGLFSRFAALGLIGMTMFIQLAVFPTLDHWINPASWWAASLLVVFARGPGFLSVDKFLGLDAKRTTTY
ncbi:DoxX family protein [Colwellia sp. 4_MG-2023]|uniref:DoxX family protein n=1 Tax=unclassified Colwellia TaxID=196834 RepID=UPI001C08AB30|nr:MULTISPECIES: DoxX family protein [unclassified Colwellia]MBU2923441.1 DoxX family protein [Colwellia sp. C2M11]MDO6489091.1 DoxX family protein [Colwellia sp. 6_MG-2023]MDO6508121.1 DoxX family protein [Colwellia sp. 5_MG-2023]MDO6556855.1 DoxX family protein [Colwellia sp. 4_MG-2023]MDO6653801.1 DoxX family protein [Colwellia sp. 3_MG-2023]